MIKDLCKGIFNKLPDSLKYPVRMIRDMNQRWPDGIIIEATNVCNLACPMCPTSYRMTRGKGLMSFDTFKSIADEIAGKVPQIHFNWAGEPTLNKNLWKFVRYAGERGIKTNISTNCTLLAEQIDDILNSEPSRLVVCLDGTTKKVHERYRIGSNFEEVCKGIKLLCKAKRERNKKHPHINLQCIVTSYNEKQIRKMLNMAKDLGVDSLSLKPLSLGSLYKNEKEKYRLARRWLPSKERYKRYTLSDKTVLLKNVPGICRWYRNLVILWNGDISICCYDFNGDHIFANILKEGGIYKVFNSKKFKIIKEKIMFKQFELCKHCNVADVDAEVIYFTKNR